jgi:hypothetical protein
MQDTITPLVTRIAELKTQLSPLEAQMKPLITELEQTKLELIEAMREGRSKRTESIGGYYAIRAERKNINITDELVVRNWLGDNGFNINDYYKLDTARVKSTAESALKENGEIVPGIEVSSTEYLTIKEAS